MTDTTTILVADDEQDCIDFVRDTFADSPYEIISAADGDEALAVARAKQPQLIILDVQMPKRNGFEVFAELQADEALSSVPVIMLTGIGQRLGMGFSEKDMGQYLGNEPAAYVEKPIEPAVLKQTVTRLLKSDRPTA